MSPIFKTISPHNGGHHLFAVAGVASACAKLWSGDAARGGSCLCGARSRRLLEARTRGMATPSRRKRVCSECLGVDAGPLWHRFCQLDLDCGSAFGQRAFPKATPMIATVGIL